MYQARRNGFFGKTDCAFEKQYGFSFLKTVLSFTAN